MAYDLYNSPVTIGHVELVQPPVYEDRDDSLDSDGYFVVPRTFAELAVFRENTVRTYGNVDLTCDHCARAFRCQWAFDAYNTNGDCLDDK